MAKKKKSNIPARYRGKLLAAAGIFAAGSFVGSALDIPPMSAYFEIIAPEVLKIPDRGTSAPLSEETTQTLQTPAPEPWVPSVSVQENTYVPEQPAGPAPEYIPEPEIFPEVDIQPPAVTVPEADLPEIPAQPQPQPEPVPEPEFVPEPEVVPELSPGHEDWMDPENDWMAGIFVPAEPAPAPDPAPDPSPVPETQPEEWMDPDPGDLPVPEPSSPQTSSMTEELAGMLENLAVFWSMADNKIHLDPSCTSGTLFAGTIEEAQTVRSDGWCRRCAEHLDGTSNDVFYIKGNAFAVTESLLDCYSFSDYNRKIPSDAFGG